MEVKTKLMNVNEVAQTLRVSVQSVRRWAAEKKLRSLKLGARTVFDATDVMQFIEAARTGDAHERSGK